jgi:hypothetical protein
MAISAGDRLTIEVDVARAWDDGQVTFSLRGHPGMITIPGDSPQIVKVEKGSEPMAEKARTRSRI